MFILAVSGPQPFWVWLVVLGGLAVIGGGLYALDRKISRSSRSRSAITTHAGSAMLELQSLLEPGKRHVIEARKEKRKPDVGAGDDADASGRVD